MTSLLLPFFLSAYTLDYSRCKYASSCEVKEGVLHMRLFPGDERAEARFPGYDRFGEEIETEFLVYIPGTTRLETENQSLVFAQYKAQNGESPPLALRLKAGDRFTVTTRFNGKETVLYHGTIRREHWTRFRMRVRTGASGRVRIHQDGVRIVDYAGAIGYENTANYFKIGPYDYTRTQRSLLQIYYSRFELRRATP